MASVRQWCFGCKCDGASGTNSHETAVTSSDECAEYALADGHFFFSYKSESNFCSFGEQLSSRISCFDNRQENINENWGIYEASPPSGCGKENISDSRSEGA